MPAGKEIFVTVAAAPSCSVLSLALELLPRTYCSRPFKQPLGRAY